MIASLALVIVGLALLVGGGEILLRGAVSLATLARVTPAVIGLTVIAAGTSVPELAVSLIAALRGNQAVAIGNVVGSNIFNLTIILGLASVIRPVIIGGSTLRLDYPFLVLVTLLYLAVAADGSIGRIDAALFLVAYVGFTTYLVMLVRRQGGPAAEEGGPRDGREMARAHRWSSVGLALGLVAGGIALLVVGAHATVMGAVELGRGWGISERVIGLTIVAGGSGLPEVVTSLVASLRGRGDVAIGNVIGSNLFNILGTLGLSSLIRPIPIPREVIVSDNLWVLGLTLLIFPVMWTGRRIGRLEGGLLLASYGLYLYVLLGRTGLA